MDILFTHVTAVTMDEQNTVLSNAYVGVRDGRVAYVGTEPPSEVVTGDTIDGKEKVLMPGLVNAHTHIPMTLLRGYADDYDLHTWLFDHIFPAEAKLDDRCVYAASLLGLAECAAFGTTSITDMYDHCGVIGQAVSEAGLNANLSRGCTQFSESGLRESQELVDRWHGADDGRILVDASIHAEYTSDEALMREVCEFARKNGLGMHVHLSETRKEHEECIGRRGMTPAAWFAGHHVFDTRTTAAHCVHVTEADIDILKAHGVSVAHCPVSNLKLASGIAPIPDMLQKSLNVALGTDGVSSNNNHDLFEEIKLCAIVQKNNTREPTMLPAWDTLRLATVHGAKAQGRSDTGVVAVGKRADLILLDFSKPHLIPCYSAPSHLAYAARGSDVCLTMARGKIIYRDGMFLTIDMEKVRYEVERYALPHIRGDIV